MDRHLLSGPGLVAVADDQVLDDQVGRRFAVGNLNFGFGHAAPTSGSGTRSP